MQLPGSASARIGVFVLLALGSLALKAAAGPARDRLIDNDPGRFERAVSGILHPQRFSTTRRTFSFRSTLVLAARDDCRIAIRDAKWGEGMGPIFAEDARTVGPVTYLYRGHRYSSPPGLTLRLGRMEFEMLDRMRMHPPMHLMVAFAESSSCGDSQFGLGDISIAA